MTKGPGVLHQVNRFKKIGQFKYKVFVVYLLNFFLSHFDEIFFLGVNCDHEFLEFCTELRLLKLKIQIQILVSKI